jgi:hypothetical protein
MMTLRTVLILIVCWSAMPGSVHGQALDLRSLDLPEWQLEEDLRLGSLDGPYDAFVSPTSLQVGADGRIYVLDGGIPALRVFDADGRFLRQMGSVGEGPGRYLRPVSFGIAGDTIWVGDMRTGRLTLYDVVGNVIESTRISLAGSPAQSVVPVNLLPGGDVVVVSPSGPPPQTVREPGPIRFEQSVLRLGPGGQVRDTVVTNTAEFPGVSLRGGRQVAAIPLIRQAPLVSYDQERDVIREVHRPAPAPEEMAEFRILERERDGTSVRERRFKDAALPLSRQVRDSLVSHVRERLDGAPGSAIEEVLAHLHLPAQQPPVTQVARGADGTFWVQREPFPVSGVRVLVLDGDLEPMATLTLPPGVERWVGPITSTHVWMLVRGEFDVPMLVRYRIRR